MIPAPLPKGHPFHLTQGEMDCLVALVEGSALREAVEPFAQVREECLGSLEWRGFAEVEHVELPFDSEWDRASITDSGRQALALHEAMQ